MTITLTEAQQRRNGSIFKEVQVKYRSHQCWRRILETKYFGDNFKLVFDIKSVFDILVTNCF